MVWRQRVRQGRHEFGALRGALPFINPFAATTVRAVAAQMWAAGREVCSSEEMLLRTQHALENVKPAAQAELAAARAAARVTSRAEAEARAKQMAEAVAARVTSSASARVARLGQRAARAAGAGLASPAQLVPQVPLVVPQVAAVVPVATGAPVAAVTAAWLAAMGYASETSSDSWSIMEDGAIYYDSAPCR